MNSAPDPSRPAAPVISVVIPGYNRVGPLRETLASVATAMAAVDAEVILVDDGSTPALEQQLADRSYPRLRHIRQPNQGAMAARLHGLAEARGTFVLFLDSDDLIHPEKLSVSVEWLQRTEADVVYDDLASYERDGDAWIFRAHQALPQTEEPAEFYLKIQPVPHSPTFRRSYLLRHLKKPLIPPHRDFDPAGDVWLYYNLAAFPAKIAKIDRALTAIGVHNEDRYSRHWERIAVSALKIMEAASEAYPKTSDFLAARTRLGECAFESWRRLPRNFHASFTRRMLALWKAAPHGPTERLGGRFFQRLAKTLGPERAGRMLRVRNSAYEVSRTIGDEELERLLPS